MGLGWRRAGVVCPLCTLLSGGQGHRLALGCEPAFMNLPPGVLGFQAASRNGTTSPEGPFPLFLSLEEWEDRPSPGPQMHRPSLLWTSLVPGAGWLGTGRNLP